MLSAHTEPVAGVRLIGRPVTKHPTSLKEQIDASALSAHHRNFTETSPLVYDSADTR
jgi:hypothetical protein